MKNLMTRLLAIILLVGVLLSVFPVTVSAAENSSITLKSLGSGELAAFHVPNMFPGESITKEYLIETKHSEAITLHYRADIRTDAKYEMLAKVLKVCIKIEGQTAYDGYMRNMPSSLNHSLPAGQNTVRYTITAYLDTHLTPIADMPEDTSVDNDYMNKELVADFFWWFEDTTDVAVKLTAEKLMDGKYARGSKFSFVLKDATGKTVSTTKNDDGHIEFDSLYFSAPGTYTYTISEVKGTDSKITYDAAVYKAVITVQEDESYTVTYLRNGAEYTGLPRFLNKTKGSSGSDDPGDYDPDNPKTGDDFPLTLVSIICGSSLCLLICLLLLWKNPKKEEKDYE